MLEKLLLRMDSAIYKLLHLLHKGKKVSFDDDVYVLGDFTMKGPELAASILYGLKWNGYYKGSIMLYGHQHNHEDYNIVNRRNGLRRYDVGVDANHMTPVSAEEIITFFQ